MNTLCFPVIFVVGIMALFAQGAESNYVAGAQSQAPKATLASVKDESADDKAIDYVMEKLKSSFKLGDYSYAIEVMYTPIVERMGGKEKCLEAAKGIVALMKQQRIVMASWKVRKPYEYVKGESRSYVVIRYEALMIGAGKRLKQSGYRLGIKIADTKWQFVNCDNLTSEVYGEFFPDFPKTFKLPKVERTLE